MKDQNIRVLNSAFGDYDAVARIDKECFPTGPIDRTLLNSFNGVSRRHAIVYQDANNVAGFLLYRNLNDRIVLIRMGVDPNHRRKQIGTELLRVLKGKLNNRKCRIDVYLNENWSETMDWFRNRGFKLRGISQDEKRPECGKDLYIFSFERIECGV